jgi:NAD+ diphosphatase
MRRAARAIIIHDDKLLVMHRNKFGKEYDTLIGGNVDFGETIEQALVREVREETSLELKNFRCVLVEDAGTMYGIQYVYLCDFPGGEVHLPETSDEAQINKGGKNLYEPKWMSLSKLADSAFVSERLKQAILDGVRDGFPESPRQLDKTTIY